MLGRIVRSADFERVLGRRPCSRTAHFALHYLLGRPTPAARAVDKRDSEELSTGKVPLADQPVDDSGVGTLSAGPRHWLGLVIPKRHARRSVTRSLLKRQIRVAARHAEPQLPEGLWVVRMRSAFDPHGFPSGASPALVGAARDELATLFRQVRTD